MKKEEVRPKKAAKKSPVDPDSGVKQLTKPILDKREASEESNEADNPQLNWITKSLGVDQPEPDMEAEATNENAP